MPAQDILAVHAGRGGRCRFGRFRPAPVGMWVFPMQFCGAVVCPTGPCSRRLPVGRTTCTPVGRKRCHLGGCTRMGGRAWPRCHPVVQRRRRGWSENSQNRGNLIFRSLTYLHILCSSTSGTLPLHLREVLVERRLVLQPKCANFGVLDDVVAPVGEEVSHFDDFARRVVGYDKADTPPQKCVNTLDVDGNCVHVCHLLSLLFVFQVFS